MYDYAVLFPGQGSQYVGMGKALAAAYPEAAHIFKQADEILGFPLSTLCFYGPEADLNNTVYAQPAILTTSIAAWQVLRQHIGMEQPPLALAGHSLGEYSALVASGALDFADALRLVCARGQAMQQAGTQAPGAMLAVLGMKMSRVEALRTEIANETGLVIEIANDNCPGQVVLSGHRQALELFADRCEAWGSLQPAQMLNVSIAAHSSLMQSALPDFLAVLCTIPIREPVFPVVGNTTADWLASTDAVYAELQAQLTAPVRWYESLQLMLDLPLRTVVELAPGKTLTGIMRYISRTVKRLNVGDDPAEFHQIITLLSSTASLIVE